MKNLKITIAGQKYEIEYIKSLEYGFMIEAVYDEFGNNIVDYISTKVHEIILDKIEGL